VREAYVSDDLRAKQAQYLFEDASTLYRGLRCTERCGYCPRREGWQQVVLLEDETNRLFAKSGALRIGYACKVLPLI